MALRPQDKVTERELSDVVVDKLNNLGNLRLSENLIVKGQRIGAYANGSVIVKGTRVHDVLQGIIDSSYKLPYTFPVLELKGIDEDVEVGNTLDITITPIFTQNDAGELYRYTLERSVSGGGFTTIIDSDRLQSYTEPNVKIIDSMNILQFVATVYFEEGEIKYKQGEEIPGHVSKGEIVTTLTINGIRKCFYGSESGISMPCMTGDEVRRLPQSTTFALEEGSTFEIECFEGDTRVSFAYPAYLPDPSKVISDKLGYNIKDIFEKSTLRVKGANGYRDIEYKLFTYIPAVGFPKSDIYTITI